MGLNSDLTAYVKDALTVTWDLRDGQVVPTTDDVKLSDGAVKLEAAVLYADLANSTALARDFDKRTAARVVRSYLYVMARIILANSGAIRSFDGDRVMGIFIGDSKKTNAAKCCLKLNYGFLKIVRPEVEAKFPALKEKGYILEHTAGADVGEILLVRAGVRGSNDLIAVGAAPNIAAKLSDVREPPYRSFITDSVYDTMAKESKYTGTTDMWQKKTISVKDKNVTVYRSSYHWEIE